MKKLIICFASMIILYVVVLQHPFNTSSSGMYARPCKFVLYDLGANRGDTVERWFAKSFVGRGGINLMPTLGIHGNVEDYCIYSFEGNPAYSQKLKALEKKHRSRGRKVSIFSETVVSDVYGWKEIFIDNVSKHSYGSSIIPAKVVNVPVMDSKGKMQKNFHGLSKGVQVKSIDFVDFFQQTAFQADEIIVKMDIEGAEYDVLRKFVSSGQACRLKALIIEWHGKKIKNHAWPSGVENTLQWLLEGCSVQILHDD